MQNRPVSNVVNSHSPGFSENSEMTEQSSFSALASGKKRQSSKTWSPYGKLDGVDSMERRRTLGERSLAALTSGVADSGWDSK